MFDNNVGLQKCMAMHTLGNAWKHVRKEMALTPSVTLEDAFTWLALADAAIYLESALEQTASHLVMDDFNIPYRSF